MWNIPNWPTYLKSAFTFGKTALLLFFYMVINLYASKYVFN